MTRAERLLAIVMILAGTGAAAAAGEDDRPSTETPTVIVTEGPGVLDPEDLDADKDLMRYVAAASDSGDEATALESETATPQLHEASASSACSTDCADGGDGVTDMLDLLDVLAAWGGPAPDQCDLDQSGDVGVDDVLMILAAWGTCP